MTPTMTCDDIINNDHSNETNNDHSNDINNYYSDEINNDHRG